MPQQPVHVLRRHRAPEPEPAGDGRTGMPGGEGRRGGRALAEVPGRRRGEGGPVMSSSSGRSTGKGPLGRLADFFDDRTGYRALVHEALFERVPGGARWRYVWGSTLVFAFLTQVITGLFLWA
ncbi:MAG: hypothetical protein ACK56I_22085, partial [bacterium]